MKKFEYFMHTTHGGLTNDQMQWYGDNGWELVAIDANNIYYFKREKITESNDGSSNAG